MKKAMSFMLMPMLACGLALAQSSMSSDADNHDHMNGKTKTMTGCVQEKDGKYWLMDKKHPNGVELMSSEDLKAHVGHKVKVTGNVSKMAEDGAMVSNTTKADKDRPTSEDPMKTSHDDSATSKHERHEMKEHGMRMMNVSEMKMVSETCDMK